MLRYPVVPRLHVKLAGCVMEGTFFQFLKTFTTDGASNATIVQQVHVILRERDVIEACWTFDNQDHLFPACFATIREQLIKEDDDNITLIATRRTPRGNLSLAIYRARLCWFV